MNVYKLEYYRAVQDLNNGKASGIDNLPDEVIKNMKEESHSIFHTLH